MTAVNFSEDVRFLIDQARRGFEAGSGMAWLTAAQAAIGHRLDGGSISENPFDAASEARLHEAWEKYFDARNEGRSTPLRWTRRCFGSTHAAHAAAALED